MTLAEFADKIGETIGSFANDDKVKFIITERLDIQDAWHLSDYVCTSRAGITLWFIPIL